MSLHPCAPQNFRFFLLRNSRACILDFSWLALSQLLAVKLIQVLTKLTNKKKSMTTHFINAEIDLQESPKKLQQEIEKELEKRGIPLRWAVTKVDIERQKALVEAVVISEKNLTIIDE